MDPTTHILFMMASAFGQTTRPHCVKQWHNNMKPDKEGIWEWFEEDGTKRLVSICNVGTPDKPCLRVYWWGGYYNVHDLVDDLYGKVGDMWTVVEKNVFHAAEWPDRWGNYVGPEDSVPESQKYWMPTPEEREKILKTCKLKQL